MTNNKDDIWLKGNTETSFIGTIVHNVWNLFLNNHSNICGWHNIFDDGIKQTPLVDIKAINVDIVRIKNLSDIG